jgi:MFS family permease
MGIFTKVEDRPTPPQVYNWRVYALAAVAGSAAIMIGYDSAFIGTTLSLQSFKNEFRFDKISTAQVNLLSANIVSCYQAGAFFGALFAYVTAYYTGRTSGLALYSAIFMLGSGLMLGANGERGLGLIYAGRVLAGIGVGGASNLAPIYISEISAPAIRGRLVCMFELGWQIGGLVGFWINVSQCHLIDASPATSLTQHIVRSQHAPQTKPHSMAHSFRGSTHSIWASACW